VGDLIC